MKFFHAPKQQKPQKHSSQRKLRIEPLEERIVLSASPLQSTDSIDQPIEMVIHDVTTITESWLQQSKSVGIPTCFSIKGIANIEPVPVECILPDEVMIGAQIRYAMTTVDSPSNHVVSSNEYTGVVAITAGNKLGTGTLLTTGTHILTAAHLVQDANGNTIAANNVNVSFDLPGGRTDIAKLEQYDPRHVYQTANGVLDEVFASDTTLG
ncbi:MAG: LEPR-XLL domain-containing protein, partial [Planctomycetaceae bacterium]|nr:LEPR-XLL domain-containing protein [Planctomycetaceae bacterium]